MAAGFGLLAALIFTFPFAAGGLLVLMPAVVGFGVLALPRAGALAAAAYEAGIGFLVGAPVAPVAPMTGSLAGGTVEVRALFFGVGAGRAF